MKNAGATYGAFGTVIGIVAFRLLLAKLSLYAAELNPVLSRRLYPRALPLGGEPTEADRQVIQPKVRSTIQRGMPAGQGLLAWRGVDTTAVTRSPLPCR